LRDRERMTKRKREKDSLCMYVDDEAFYRLIFACCLFCCIMSHTLNGHLFFSQHAAAVGVCGFTGPPDCHSDAGRWWKTRETR